MMNNDDHIYWEDSRNMGEDEEKDDSDDGENRSVGMEEAKSILIEILNQKEDGKQSGTS